MTRKGNGTAQFVRLEAVTADIVTWGKLPSRSRPAQKAS